MQDHESKEEEFDIKKLLVPLTSLKAVHWIIIIGLLVYFNGGCPKQVKNGHDILFGNFENIQNK
jgi:hypothetical protein